MASKFQEKKASKQEMQHERKVKEMEEKLHETKEVLERYFLVQQAKRAKVKWHTYLRNLNKFK